MSIIKSLSFIIDFFLFQQKKLQQSYSNTLASYDHCSRILCQKVLGYKRSEEKTNKQTSRKREMDIDQFINDFESKSLLLYGQNLDQIEEPNNTSANNNQ